MVELRYIFLPSHIDYYAFQGIYTHYVVTASNITRQQEDQPYRQLITAIFQDNTPSPVITNRAQDSIVSS